MILANDHAVVAMNPKLASAAGTHDISFSKLDANGQPFSQANIFLQIGTVSTNADVFNIVRVYESDTVTTPSSMTGIVALSITGATVSDATHANFWTSGATGAGLGGVVEWQLDLRKRKKYIGLHITAPAASNDAEVSGLVLLSRGAESRDSAADANHYGTVYGNLASTNARGNIMRIIG